MWTIFYTTVIAIYLINKNENIKVKFVSNKTQIEY